MRGMQDANVVFTCEACAFAVACEWQLRGTKMVAIPPW